MYFKRLFFIFFFLVSLFGKISVAQFYYGMQMDFGKNRIQYQNFEWTYFDFDRFRIYTYQGGQEVAKYVATSATNLLPVMEKRLDFQVEDKIQILVYNNQNDFKQSNLGLSAEEQTNVGGVTHIVGDKISVFFNGSHADLDKQLRAALAELMIDQFMYGGRARDVVRNSTLLVLPEWYKKGLVAYLSEGWDAYIDNKFMDVMKNDGLSRFNRLSGKEALITGHALWYYVADTYGESFIQSILYMTKISRNSDYAFTAVTGTSLSNMILDMTDAWNRRYYMYSDTLRTFPQNTVVLPKPKKTRHYFNLKVSPDGQKVIYASNEMGQFKVWVNTVGEKKHLRLLKYGPKVERMDDFNYPLLAWHPNNTIVAMLYERKDQIILQTIDLESKENFKRNITGFEKINSFAFSSDGKKLVLSGVKKGKGQADIFVLTLNSGGLEQLTNDIWDDNYPVFIQNNKGVVFQSNRKSDTVRATDDAKYSYKLSRTNDLFYAAYPFRSQVLLRVTNTPDVNETQPQEYSKNQIAYLSESNGIYNRYIANQDSGIAFVDTIEHYRYFFNAKPVTNYDRNIIEQNINYRYSKKAEIFYNKGSYSLTVSDLEPSKNLKEVQPRETWFKASGRPLLSNPEKISYAAPRREEEQSPTRSTSDTAKKQGIDFNSYTLSGENKPKTEIQPPTATLTPQSKPDSLAKKPIANNDFRFPIQQNYYTAFYMDYIVTQLDNSYLGTTYQRFTGGSSPIYLNPGLNALFKVGLSDLMEDQRIVAGVRISGTLDNEFFLSYENRKRLVDQQIVLHRQSFLKVDDYYGQPAKININDARYLVKVPFNEIMSTRFSIFYRNDRTVFASVGDFSLPKKNVYDNYGGAKVEFIYDDTRKRGLNLYNGVRFKVWAEYWRKIVDVRHDLITFGFDARAYKKLHRDLIWCNRIAGGSALGTDRLIFYLGGVDNWFNAAFNQSINVVHPETYQFQTLATNMRGFKQNIRNGNNFLVYNSEIRFPIFKYLSNRPIRSDFINNFQIVLFGDLGMAWYGKDPLSDDNVLNRNTYYNNPITLTIYDQKNPLVGGYGLGFRTRLLGYFVRLDFGWGVDDMRISKKSITYLSFTTDF